MKKTTFIFPILCILLAACSPNAEVERQLEAAKMELEEAKAVVEQAQAELDALKSPEAGLLVHVVYFKLKKGLSEQEKAAFIAEVKKLAQIEEVQGFQIGAYEDLGDPRALSDYNMVMQMGFANKADYEKYQQHPTHLALKDNTAKYMGGPPATYDFLTK